MRDLGSLTSFRAKGRQFLSDETGATAVEYGILMLMLSSALFVALSTAGDRISEVFTVIADLFDGEADAPSGP